MSTVAMREAHIAETCARKYRYESWEDARRAGLAVWRENPRPDDANAPTPYVCDHGGERHYHVGHYRSKVRPT